jgi:hypothetical protein
LVVVDELVLSFINFLGFVLIAEICCLVGLLLLFWLCRKKQADPLVLFGCLFFD